MAGLRLERDWQRRDLRRSISKHGHGKMADLGERRNGASLVSSRERVVLSRRVGEYGGCGAKYESTVLARAHHDPVSGCGIHDSPMEHAVRRVRGRPAVPDDSTTAAQGPR